MRLEFDVSEQKMRDKLADIDIASWRVNGPYQHGRKWRITFSRGSGDARQTVYQSYDSEEEARAATAVDKRRDIRLARRLDHAAKTERRMLGIRAKLDHAEARKQIREKRGAMVYLIRCLVDERGPVKIGHAADMEWRLGGLRNGNPWDLVVLATSSRMPKSKAVALEMSLHEEFKHLRMRGEWFRWTDELLTLPERIAALG